MGIRIVDRTRGLPRRAWLKAIGCAGAVLPFVPGLDAEADAMNTVPKLVLFWTANGPVYGRWRPSGSAQQWDLSEALAPLAAHKDDLIVLAGVHKSPGKNAPGSGSTHTRGIGYAWTAELLNYGNFQDNGPDDAGWANGPSVDQYIAQRLDPQTKFKTLELGVDVGEHSPRRRMIFAGADQPITPRIDPVPTFDALFEDLDLGTAEREALRARRQSVIDLVADELGAVNNAVGHQDKIKIEAHLTAVRELETQINADAPQCEPPLAPSGDLDPEDRGDIPALVRQMIDLGAVALACDVTRILSFQLGFTTYSRRMSWLGHPDEIHGYGHYDSSDTASQDRCVEASEWFAGEFAYLLDKLKAARVLDSSMVVWNEELGRTNNHTLEPTPWVVAGSACGYLSPGRYLEFGDGGAPDLDNGEPHSKLLVSMCRAMGLDDVDRFGNPDFDGGGGPLPGLTG